MALNYHNMELTHTGQQRSKLLDNYGDITLNMEDFHNIFEGEMLTRNE